MPAGREFEGYAHLTTHAPSNDNVALLNTAHIGGTRFSTGDEVIVKNTSSGHSEKATVRIVSAYTDLDNTDVIIQLAQQPANMIGLTKELGKIKVIVKREKVDKKDPDRWRCLSELIKQNRPDMRGFTRAPFLSPTAINPPESRD